MKDHPTGQSCTNIDQAPAARFDDGRKRVSEVAIAVATNRKDSLRQCLVRARSLFAAQPVASLIVLFIVALWAFVIGLLANFVVAGLAALLAAWVITLAASDEHEYLRDDSVRLGEFALQGIGWATSLVIGLVVGEICYHLVNHLAEDDLVRLWLAFAGGLLVWSLVSAAALRRFSRPRFAEYERWLVWSTVFGVTAGAVRATLEATRKSASNGLAGRHPATDIFGAATDTASRATFGMAIFGGVLLLAVWLGSYAGTWLRRKCTHFIVGSRGPDTLSSASLRQPATPEN